MTKRSIQRVPMAGYPKQIPVLTTYQEAELKLIQVVIRRYNIKRPAIRQPIERDLAEPYSITYLVHMPSKEYEYGKLVFKTITPNTIKLTADAYCKIKSISCDPIEDSNVQLDEQGLTSCSSDVDVNGEFKPIRNSRSREKSEPKEVDNNGKPRRRSIEPERKSTVSPTKSPSPQKENNPVHFHPRHASRSRSRSPLQRHSSNRNRSSSPDYSWSSNRFHEPAHSCKSCSRSPSKRSSTSSFRRSRSISPENCSRSRSPHCSRPSLDTELERNKHDDAFLGDRCSHSKSPSPRRRRGPGHDDIRESYPYYPHERRLDDRRPEFLGQPEFYPHGHFYDPVMIRPQLPPYPFYPRMAPFVPRPYFDPGIVYRRNHFLPRYNNRAIPRFVGAGVATTTTVTNNSSCTGSNSKNITTPDVEGNGCRPAE